MNSSFKFFCSLFAVCVVLNIVRAQIKLSTFSGSPTPAKSCAVLELESTTKGLRLPLISGTAATPTVTAPLVRGLIIYNASIDSVQYYNGVKWISL